MNRFWSNVLLAFVTITLCSACEKMDVKTGGGELPTEGVLTSGVFTVAKENKSIFLKQIYNTMQVATYGVLRSISMT